MTQNKLGVWQSAENTTEKEIFLYCFVVLAVSKWIPMILTVMLHPKLREVRSNDNDSRSSSGFSNDVACDA